MGPSALTQTIDTAGDDDSPTSIFAADFDGDGDVDVLASFYYSGPANGFDKIAWYENTDGMGTLGPQKLILERHFLRPRSVAAGDFDGDGDLDVIALSDSSEVECCNGDLFYRGTSFFSHRMVCEYKRRRGLRDRTSHSQSGSICELPENFRSRI